MSKEKSDKNKKELNELVLIIPCILVTILVGFFTLKPWVSDVLTMRSDLKSDQDLLNQVLEPKSSLLDSLSEETLGQTVDTLEEVLPSYPYPWLLMAVLENLAEVSEMSLSQVSIGVIPSSGKAKISSFTVPVSLKGNISQVSAFLKNAHRVKRIISLEQLSLDYDEGEAYLSCIVRVWYHPVQSSLGPVEEALVDLKIQDEETLSLVAKLNSFGLRNISDSENSQDIVVGKDNLF